MTTLITIGSNTKRFSSGDIVITSNAMSQLDPDDIAQGVTRHLSGDWGEVSPPDAQANDDALRDGDRLFSVYGTGKDRFWVITEWNRSVTTVLLPEDY